jgi:hypothetical protein
MVAATDMRLTMTKFMIRGQLVLLLLPQQQQLLLLILEMKNS